MMDRNLIHTRILTAALALSLWAGRAAAQEKILEWASWTAIQAVPSPGFTLDGGDGGTSVVGELRWQVVPLNYSFGVNRMASPVQCLIVNPLHRHAGSVEAFLEPAWALQPYRRSGDDRFGMGAGLRMFLPLAEYGESLSFSAGAKYIGRNAAEGGRADAAGLELGIYTLFGILGARVDLTTDPAHRASFSVALKYY